jgi:predicted CXXCH cytochrome family protein
MCGICHQDKVKLVEDGEWNLHAPFGMGECLFCHDSHAGEAVGNTVAPGGELCSACHDLEDADLSGLHMGLPLDELDCLSCHTPHASPSEHGFRAVLHPPFEDESCDMCHDTGADDPRVLLSDPPELCEMCHGDVTEVENAASIHKPVQEGRCLHCHMPHASDQEKLVRGSGKTLCLSCHQEMRQRADQSAAHHLDFPGVACTSCHTPHASGERRLLKGGGLETCGACHEEHLNFAHPMGEKATNPNTGEPVDCLSCHDPHGTSFAFALRDDPKRPLCLRCHSQTQ